MTLKAKLTPSNGVNYTVVSNPGTLFERIEDYCQTLSQAIACKDCYDCPADIMKVMPNGELKNDWL